MDNFGDRDYITIMPQGQGGSGGYRSSGVSKPDRTSQWRNLRLKDYFGGTKLWNGLAWWTSLIILATTFAAGAPLLLALSYGFLNYASLKLANLLLVNPYFKTYVNQTTSKAIRNLFLKSLIFAAVVSGVVFVIGTGWLPVTAAFMDLPRLTQAIVSGAVMFGATMSSPAWAYLISRAFQRVYEKFFCKRDGWNDITKEETTPAWLIRIGMYLSLAGTMIYGAVANTTVGFGISAPSAAVTGGVIGGVAFVAVLVVAIFFIRRSRARNKYSQQNDQHHYKIKTNDDEFDDEMKFDHQSFHHNQDGYGPIPQTSSRTPYDAGGNTMYGGGGNTGGFPDTTTQMSEVAQRTEWYLYNNRTVIEDTIKDQVELDGYTHDTESLSLIKAEINNMERSETTITNFPLAPTN